MEIMGNRCLLLFQTACSITLSDNHKKVMNNDYENRPDLIFRDSNRTDTRANAFSANWQSKH